jgi:DNA primase
MPTIDYRLVRSRIRIQQVLDLLQFQPHTRLGDELRGPCPIHGSTSERSRSFAVNVAKNTFRCFSCGASGNQLDLWVAICQLPLYEATLDLCQQLAEKVPVLQHGAQLKPRDSQTTGRSSTAHKKAMVKTGQTRSPGPPNQAPKRHSRSRLEMPKDIRHNNNT